MSINDDFNTLQGEVNADPEVLKEARRRRNLFCNAFDSESDVLEAFPSGSLARGSQIEPINDVDVVIIYDKSKHPDWGTPGTSASDALDHVQSQVRALLGDSEGTIAREVRLAKPLNHAVKCWLDDPDEEDAFTVDVTPAVKDGSILQIPEKKSSDWIHADPKYLIREVARRHAEWGFFVPMVRVLKRWNRDAKAGMKSLVVEVLALTHLREADRSQALAAFFAAAATAVSAPVEDPAGLCGEIQPDLDRVLARQRLEGAAEMAWRAVKAEEAGDLVKAACLWREVFGDIFPEPPGGCGNGGKGIAAVPLITHRPRPVRDAPQG